MIKRINDVLAARRAELAEGDQKGFTLVELLVVVIIIGILAAIAIPFFLNQRQSAWESQVESDIANAVIAAETYSTNNDGSYSGLDLADLTANGFTGTPDVTVVATPVTVGGVANGGYTLSVTHANLDGTWVYSSETGETDAP